MRILLFCLLLILLNTGCTKFTSQPTVYRYTLNQLPVLPTPIISKKQLIIVIAPIQTQLPYDSTQIYYTTQPNQTQPFSKNFWIAPPAYMLQPLVMQTLNQTGLFKAVTSPLTSYDWVLYIHILEFKQSFLTRPSEINLKLRLTWVQAQTGTIYTKDIAIDTKASQDTPAGGVSAANQAIAKALLEIYQEAFCLAKHSYILQ